MKTVRKHCKRKKLTKEDCNEIFQVTQKSGEKAGYDLC